MNLKQILRVTGFLSSFCLVLGVVYAQEHIDHSEVAAVESNDTVWYMQPWIWAVAIALLIVCIAYYSKNSRQKNLKEGAEKGLR